MGKIILRLEFEYFSGPLGRMLMDFLVYGVNISPKEIIFGSTV